MLRARTDSVKLHFRFGIATLWNELPLTVISLPHLTLFKHALRNQFWTDQNFIYTAVQSEKGVSFRAI